MFTGLIEAVCTIKAVNRRGESLRFLVDLDNLADETKIGDSIALNGVCLTVSGLDGNIATFDVSGETLRKSTLGRLKTSYLVNVERAMKPTDRFGGHFVLGHIDGTATVKAVEKQGEFAVMRFSAPADLLEQMVKKGSVAVDGISLTIADMDNASFSVAIIPATLEKTTLSKLKIADVVNIETDIIVKTVKKQLENLAPAKGKLTIEKLKELGF